MSTSNLIDTVEKLENVVGKTPPAMHLKVIDHLDAGALRWIALARLMFAAFQGSPGIALTIGGGDAGFASGNTRELRIPTPALDDPSLAQPGKAFGSLFLIPGIGETLRVNGKVMAVEADHLRVAVEECYGHCAKALIRSNLWSVQLTHDASGDLRGVVTASRFLALATLDTEGHADVSPKGDPSGSLAHLDGTTLSFADRPGNRRIDSFRNILVQPNVALTLLVPGTSKTVLIRGKATLTTDQTLRNGFVVRDKIPLLAILVETSTIESRNSMALERAKLWPVLGTPAIDAAKLFVEHIKLNRDGGLGASLAKATLSITGVPNLLKKGLEKDYKENLY
jgi:predicted pyridoxine 5'-phosphate oxidase superfamily flavin-nucleotide-binding protein